MNTIQNESELTELKKPLTKFPNILVFGTAGLNLFLARYQSYYQRRNTELARLPVHWPTDLNNAQLSILKAKIAPFELSFVSSDSSDVHLIMELKSGTLLWNETEEIAIKSWKIPLKTTIDVTRTQAITGDGYPYYKLSFDKIKENYIGIAQLHLKTQEAVSSSEIDFADAQLNQEQKQVITERIKTLVKNYINCHENFVLFYIGLGSKSEDIGTYQRHLFFPQILRHTIYKDENTAEIRIHYRNFIGNFSDWNGDLSQPLVPFRNSRPSGILLYGQMSIFTYLIKAIKNVTSYKVLKNENGITKIVNLDGGHKVWITLLQKEETIRFNVQSEYNLSETTQLPVLGSNTEFYDVTYTMAGERDFEIGIRIDTEGKSLKLELLRDDIINPKKDVLINKQLGNERIIRENTEEFKCVISGELTKLTIEQIIKACGRFDCTQVIQAYEKSNKIAHKLYWSLKNRITFADDSIKFSASPYQFFHFPETEIVTFKNLRIDDAWNVLLDINAQAKP